MNAPFAIEPASLYVGDLHPDVTEALLFEIFNSIGAVASIRVNRDAVTRRSLGYAYVNFHNSADAERAMEALNYTHILNKPCRIMWSHRDPSKRKAGVGNIFVKNLDPGIDHKALYDTFIAFGPILSCKVAMDETGQSKGYGFVHFENQESADNAIAKVNGMLLNGKQVYVGPFVRKTGRGSSPNDAFTNLFVKNLDSSISEEALKEIFEEFGAVVSAVIMKDETGTSKGFGFVNYEIHESARDAVDNLNEKEIQGKKLFVGRAQKKNEREAELRAKFDALKIERIQKTQANNVYIKNIDDTIDAEKLKAEFSCVGPISSGTIMTDEHGVSRGFGFICFTSPDDAQKAVNEMNGRMLANKPLYVALAQRKETRQQAIQAQVQQRAMQNGGFRMMGAPQQGAPVYAGPSNQPVYGYPNQAVGYPQGGAQRPVYVQYPQQQVYARPIPAGGRGYPGGPQGRPIVSAYPQMVPAGTVVNAGPIAGGKFVPGPGSGPGGQAGRPGPRQQQPLPARGPAGPAPQPASPSNAVPNGTPPEAPAAAAPLVAQLNGASQEERTRILGERLYGPIYALQPDTAGKITGMLLEMDNASILSLLENPHALESKVKEAALVLQQAQLAAGASAGAGSEPAAASPIAASG